MLKSAMSSDATVDIAAFKHIITKFCTGDFHTDSIGLFMLAWMFAFVKNEQGGQEKQLQLSTVCLGKNRVVDCNMG